MEPFPLTSHRSHIPRGAATGPFRVRQRRARRQDKGGGCWTELRIAGRHALLSWQVMETGQPPQCRLSGSSGGRGEERLVLLVQGRSLAGSSNAAGHESLSPLKARWPPCSPPCPSPGWGQMPLDPIHSSCSVHQAGSLQAGSASSKAEGWFTCCPAELWWWCWALPRGKVGFAQAGGRAPGGADRTPDFSPRCGVGGHWGHYADGSCHQVQCNPRHMRTHAQTHTYIYTYAHTCRSKPPLCHTHTPPGVSNHPRHILL